METEELYPALRELLNVEPGFLAFSEILRFLRLHEQALDDTLIEYVSQHLEAWPNEDRRTDGFVHLGTPWFSLVRSLRFFGFLWQEDAPLSELTHIKCLVISHDSITKTLLDVLHESPLLEHVEALDLSGDGLLDSHIIALVNAPAFLGIRSLKFRTASSTNKALHAIAGSRYCQHLKALDLFRNKGIGDEGVIALVTSPHLSQLEKLDLSLNKLTMESISALTRSPQMGQLQELGLAHLKLGDELAEAIVASPHLRQLKTLGLSGCELSAQAVAALLGSPNLQHIEDLRLVSCGIGLAGLKALRTSPYLSHLQVLCLNGAEFWEEDDEAYHDEAYDEEEAYEAYIAKVAACFRSPNFERVHTLHFDASDLGTGELEVIVRSPALSNLKALYLNQMEIEAEVLEAIAGAPSLSGLEVLSLWNCDISDEGVIALAKATHLTSLRDLTLQENEITGVGLQALVNSPICANLTSLCLANNEGGDVGAKAIAQSQYLTKLRFLQFDRNKVGDEGTIALAESPNMRHVREFTYGDNLFEDAGMYALAKSSNLGALEEIFLKWNPIPYESFEAFREAFPHVCMEHDFEEDDDDD